jgi:hypothetical protein
MLQAEQRRRHIITFCADLDGLLGGGVAPGEITECVLLHTRALLISSLRVHHSLSLTRGSAGAQDLCVPCFSMAASSHCVCAQQACLS